ncbi:hypothetical protein LX76_00412 [Cereibacter changlensis]|uniref:Uncharacterized protein n=3 Tax=Cereibacter changlensis TaxID=402884 RepID=A0A2W7RUM8_9RHOB|nr:hypothetical protein [Cereibacter changlensis]PZX58907.1 hypothetical protein LX76_00412 [Cereibacter changlensis]
MFRKAIAPALLGALLAVPAFAQDVPMVRSIDVETSLSDLNNAEAAAYWQTLDADLEAGIAAQLIGRLGDEGMDIKIDMSEVELANYFEAAVGSAETKLQGTVNVVDMNNNANFETFDLTVSMDQALPLLPPGTDLNIIPPTSTEVYAGVVAAFAKAVVDRIDG